MKADFVLDAKLAHDCHQLGELNEVVLLLMDNALVPWFILVPKTSAVELCDLSEPARRILEEAIDRVSLLVRQHWPVEKLNVAAIGNVVRQLHIHVVGRRQGDYCWPGVVWGRTEREAYSVSQLAEIRRQLKTTLGTDFKEHGPSPSDCN
ncbi:MAG: HIT family protein [Gammaproteobacteria bacterium]